MNMANRERGSSSNKAIAQGTVQRRSGVSLKPSLDTTGRRERGADAARTGVGNTQ